MNNPEDDMKDLLGEDYDDDVSRLCENDFFACFDVNDDMA